ncbi:ribonuclease P protein subunit p25-like protein [Denticeps clupeoides]|uniref:ribonuclease P protein subunit p25-like protein n=1 Tax=Denticeps clupeoides TaxID=299321 RepID=UPI0010A358AF|nr:ribonuclease P protein subunit p25-like protein [Denticeps clupeoides]
MSFPRGENSFIYSPSSGTTHLDEPLSRPPVWTTLPPSSTLKPGRTGFKKVCTTGEASPCPFPGLGTGILEMRVKEGSKIRNLLGFAMARMQEQVKPDGQVGVTQVLFTGLDRAITKTITCAEIMKRQVQGLHQLSKLQYTTVREVWENKEDGRSRMTIHRTVPSICILLSKDPLDPTEPGYQHPADVRSVSDPRDIKGERVVCRKRTLSPCSQSKQPNAKKAHSAIH